MRPLAVLASSVLFIVAGCALPRAPLPPLRPDAGLDAPVPLDVPDDLGLDVPLDDAPPPEDAPEPTDVPNDSPDAFIPPDVPVDGGCTMPTVVPTSSGYRVGDPIVVAYDCMPGNPRQWVAVFPAGASDSPTDRRHWEYVSGAFGTVSLTLVGSPGRWVVRAYGNDSITSRIAESPSFDVVP